MNKNPEYQSRHVSEQLEEILGCPFKVLDDGFVRVVDYMGTDESIVQAARISYGKGTRRVHEDRGLIRYLMRHRHTTPFEMCEIKLHVRVPMDCWRQWIRHRTANVNEYSTRYSEAINAAQRTEESGWREQTKASRQGSGPFISSGTGEYLSRRESELQTLARTVYEERLSKGVAREQARKDLPLSTYTEAYWKIDLHNLLHFLSLRMDAHAQYEIRQYANLIGKDIVGRWVPQTWEAFSGYRLEGMVLSNIELDALGKFHLEGVESFVSFLVERKWLRQKGSDYIPNREGREFAEKLKRMNIQVPWEMQDDMHSAQSEENE